MCGAVQNVSRPIDRCHECPSSGKVFVGAMKCDRIAPPMHRERIHADEDGGDASTLRLFDDRAQIGLELL